jgi:hypothetical protein
MQAFASGYVPFWKAYRMERYDPAKAPNPAAWLELDEGERLQLVETYHRRARIRGPNQKAHAIVHVVIENQVALGDELPVQRTIGRLMDEGLDRHEAVHAVGTVLSEFLWGVMQDQTPFAQDDYNAAVERLTAESWLASFDKDDGKK